VPEAGINGNILMMISDFIGALNLHNVRYILGWRLLCGATGYSRTTGDMDIWVERNHVNYLNIVRAFQTFGIPTLT